MRTCSQCGQSEPQIRFYPSQRGNKCNKCRGDYQRQVRAKKGKKISGLKPDPRMGYVKDLNPEELKKHHVDNRLMRKYSISLLDFEEMYSRQGGLCAICHHSQREDKRTMLFVDHCHKTDTVRELLCNYCNLALGAAEDSPERLRAMADYLEKHSAADGSASN